MDDLGMIWGRFGAIGQRPGIETKPIRFLHFAQSVFARQALDKSKQSRPYACAQPFDMNAFLTPPTTREIILQIIPLALKAYQAVVINCGHN